MAIGVAEYRTIDKLIVSYRPTARTDDLLAELKALSLVKDGETGSRGLDADGKGRLSRAQQGQAIALLEGDLQ